MRRPEDKQFKIAQRLRTELAQQAKHARAEAPGAAAALADTSVSALLAALQAQIQASLPQARDEPSAPPAAPRDTTPGQGWDLPERRKFRFRLEDVGFE